MLLAASGVKTIRSLRDPVEGCYLCGVSTLSQPTMQQKFVFFLILAVAVAIYWPILRIARKTITARGQAGRSNSILFAVLLIPLFGPLIFLVVRGRFEVKEEGENN
ncbi:MAG: hypothetical protein ACI81P_001201 [Neolewinella sp.]|jgi:hypothetical protein